MSKGKELRTIVKKLFSKNLTYDMADLKRWRQSENMWKAIMGKEK